MARRGGAATRFAVITGLCSAILACNAATSPALPTIVPITPIPTVAPTVAVTPSASPTAAPAALCFSGASPCALSPGTFTTAPFKPAFHFTLADGWSNDILDPTGGEVVDANGSIFWLAKPQGADQSGQTVTIGSTPAAVVTYLTKLAGVTVSTPVSVTIGGDAATQIDITSTVRNNFVLVTSGRDHPGGIGFGLHATTKARFLILSHAGTTITIVVSTESPSDFSSVIATVQPILDSIGWD